MDALELIDQQLHKEQMLYNTIFELLSFEKITFNGLWAQALPSTECGWLLNSPVCRCIKLPIFSKAGSEDKSYI